MANPTKHLLVVGLGNYTHPNTRHSVGMMIVDALAQRFNAPWVKRGVWQAEIATVHTTLQVPKPMPAKAIQHPNAARRAHLIQAAGAAPTTATATATATAAANPSTATATATTESVSTAESISTTEPTSSAAPESTTMAKPKPSKREKVTMDVTITLMKPTLLMNVSGTSVYMAAKGLGIPYDDLIVIHDDMERELGKVSFKTNGSHNGHNGIKSCIKSLSTQHFRRLRVGIGRPTKPTGNRDRDVVSSFVLGKFKPLEIEKLEDSVYDLAHDEVLRIVTPSKSMTDVKQSRTV